MANDIAENVKHIKEKIARAAQLCGRSPDEIILVAASKTNGSAAVARAIAAGIEVCGENRVQEMLEKNEAGAYSGAQLHFIGHLQKNKVKQVVGLCGLIQSVDSEELLRLIDERAALLGICQDILLEINIGGEESKGGFLPRTLPHILETASKLSNARVRGLMAIPPISLEKGFGNAYFAQMHKLFVDNSLKKYDNVSMDFLSMGMSGDFEDAISEGSNMVRVGSAIFGERDYGQTK
jgi:pyridoxal phosphate enzyme (YggS family)